MRKRNVALIVLYDDKRRILLQHRSQDAGRYPGCWAFFGGGIEGNETPEQAVRRECLEELCYNLDNPRLVITRFFTNTLYCGEKYIFIERYNPEKKLAQKEGSEMKWADINEISQLKTIEHDKEIYDFLKLILPIL